MVLFDYLIIFNAKFMQQTIANGIYLNSPQEDILTSCICMESYIHLCMKVFLNNELET